MKKILFSFVFIAFVFSVSVIAQDLPEDIKELKAELRKISKNIFVDYDRFDKSLIIRGNSRRNGFLQYTGWSLLIPNVDEKNKNKIVFTYSYAQLKLKGQVLNNNDVDRVIFLVDDERIKKHTTNTDTNNLKIGISYHFEFNLDELEKILNAKSVEYKIGDVEFKLKKKHRKDWELFVEVVKLVESKLPKETSEKDKK